MLPSDILALGPKLARKVRAALAGTKKSKDNKIAKPIDPKKKIAKPKDEDAEDDLDLDEDADEDLELDEDADDEDADDEDAGDPPFKKKKASQAIADRAAAIEMRRAAARSLGISERKFTAATASPTSNAFTPIDPNAPRKRSESADAKVIREIREAGQAVRETIVANAKRK